MPIPEKIITPVLNAKEYVYSELLEWIITGVLQPGEQINDIALAKHFSTSRTPVREALQALIQLNLIEVRPQRGTFVTSPNRKEVDDLYQAISLLSYHAGIEACNNCTDHDLDVLREINERLREGIRSGKKDGLYKIDLEFHQHMFHMMGNYLLEDFAVKLMLRVSRYENLYYTEGLNQEDSVSCHEEIIQALKDGKAELVAEKSRANWADFYKKNIADVYF